MHTESDPVLENVPEGNDLMLPDSTAGDAGVDIELLAGVPKGFAINSAEHANWLVRKIVGARIYSSHVKNWAEQEQRRAEREEQALLFLFGRQLESWAGGEIAKLHKRKSLALPGGVVGFRSVPPRLIVDDEPTVLAWAKKHCSKAVVVTERLSKSTLDDFIKATGLIPDAGVRLAPAGERFYVR